MSDTETETEYDSNMNDIDSQMNQAIANSLYNIDTTIDNSLELAISNSLKEINMNQIYNDSFTVDVLPGIFYEKSCEQFHKVYGDGIILPSRLAAVITDLEISDIIVMRFVIGECEYYGYIADYIDGDYAYVPGNILGADFMPGQMVDFEIVNRRMNGNDCLKPATKVILKFDCDMTGINFRELLEPWIGNVYRCLVTGNILVIEAGFIKYNVEVCKVYNIEGECDFAIAYNTDLAIELILPPVTEQVVNGYPEQAVQVEQAEQAVQDDINVESDTKPIVSESVKLSIAELRAQRLAYFNKK
jgi:hypothetical protein